MLSKNQLVRVRKAFEAMYDSVCTVVIQEEYEKGNGSIGHRLVTILEDVPCHLQYSSVSDASQDDAVATVAQEIRLFITPEEEIPAGSKITVNSVDYTHSGVVAKYATHQEIVLRLLERWS